MTDTSRTTYSPYYTGDPIGSYYRNEALNRIADALEKIAKQGEPKTVSYAKGGVVKDNSVSVRLSEGEKIIVTNHRQDEDPYEDEDEYFLRGVE